VVPLLLNIVLKTLFLFSQEETRKAVEEVKLTLTAQLKATKQMVADASLTAQNASRLATKYPLEAFFSPEEKFVLMGYSRIKIQESFIGLELRFLTIEFACHV
jgi:hypothetical protein